MNRWTSFNGAHHVQVEHGERQDVAVADAAVDEEVDGEGEDQEVEEALVEGLAAAEERHLEVVPDLLGPLPLGRPRHAADLPAVGVGGPDVVDAR